MKKLIYIALFCALQAIVLSAAPVTSRQAMRAAQNFMAAEHLFMPQGSFTVERIERITLPDGMEFYALHLSPAGFILLSTQSELPAVLAYSAQNRFVDTPTAQALLTGNLQGWEYIIRTQPDRRTEHKKQWQALLTTPVTFMAKTGGDSIYYFPTPVWGQGYANGALVFNYYTPNHWSAGCVATAMAEVLAFYRWPLVGTGSHCYTENDAGQLCADFANTYYDWANMLNKYEGEYTTSAQRKAAGLLTYHAAVSVNMDFSSSGSTANVSNAPSAFHNYFRLSGHYKSVSADGFWDEVVNNMKDARPVILAIHRSDGLGHAIVADGFAENNGNFHLNMGWNGDDNGWYDIRGTWNAGGYNAVDGASKGLVPNPMINPQIEMISETAFILSWSISPRLQAQYFELQQATGASGHWSSLNAAISDTFYQVQVDQIGNYYYRVRARRDDIWWDWSAVQKISLGGPRYLTFNVDMTYQSLGAEDSVVLRGNLPPLKGSENSAALSDDNGDQIYSITMPFDLDYAGQELLYRFAVAGPAGTRMESSNRSYLIDWAEQQVLDTVYFDDYVTLESSLPLPAQTELIGNYPNPFGAKQSAPGNAVTRIRYRIAHSGKVRLTVYNILGQQVAELVNKIQVPGAYAVKFHAPDLPGGVYFCRLQCGSSVAVRKMILVR